MSTQFVLDCGTKGATIGLLGDSGTSMSREVMVILTFKLYNLNAVFHLISEHGVIPSIPGMLLDMFIRKAEEKYLGISEHRKINLGLGMSTKYHRDELVY